MFAALYHLLSKYRLLCSGILRGILGWRTAVFFPLLFISLFLLINLNRPVNTYASTRVVTGDVPDGLTAVEWQMIQETIILDAPTKVIQDSVAAAASVSAEQKAKLLADDAAAENRFGYSVAISGEMVVVGAYGDGDTGDSAFRSMAMPGLKQTKPLLSILATLLAMLCL